MKYSRSLSVHCEACEASLVIDDGTTITREMWNSATKTWGREACAAGEAGQPVKVQTALWFALDSGWTAMGHRNLDGSFERITEVGELEQLPPARKLFVVCGDCADTYVPRLSTAALRELEEAGESERALIERVARLEAQVAALTGLAEAVAS